MSDDVDALRDELNAFFRDRWEKLEVPFCPVSGTKAKAAELLAKKKARKQAGELFVREFAPLAARVFKMFPDAFDGLPKLPPHRGRLPRDSPLRIKGKFYDAAKVDVAHFGLEGQLPCGMRCLFWGAVAHSPNETDATLDAPGFIRDWAGGLTLGPPATRGLWRTLGQPIKWAVERAFPALLVASPPAGGTGQAEGDGKKRPQRKRGRPAMDNVKDDARLVERWKASGMQKKDFAVKNDITIGVFKRIVGRVTKREVRRRTRTKSVR